MKEKTDHGGQRLKYILGKEAEKKLQSSSSNMIMNNGI